MNIRMKLFSSFMVLTLFMILASAFDYVGIKRLSRSINEMYNEHYLTSVTLGEIKSDINASRALWLTLMSEKDRDKMDALKKKLQDELNKKIDQGFDNLQKVDAGSDMKASFKELNEAWNLFRETRDKQMFPLVYADKRDEAKTLAIGIQAERYNKMVAISDKLIGMESKEAETAQKDADSRAKRSALILIALSVIGFSMSITIAVSMSGNIASRVREVAGASEAIAKGDMTKELVVAGGDEIGKMAVSFKEMQKNISDIVSQVREASGQVSIAADQIARGNQDFSQRITEQAASIEETASTMEEMSSAVRQNADSAREANKLASEARRSAEEGGNVMGNMIMAMKEISGSSKKISEITDVIDEIAFQTNILALNAAVEAARAGDQGRGFAVVAVEVRNLAQRSAQAAKEISTLIKDSVQKVEDGQELANESKATLDGIINHVKRVADLIGEMSAASQEQAEGIDQVNKAIAQMDQVTQQNASLAEEASATAEEMSAESKALLDLVSFFKTSDEGDKKSLSQHKGHGHGWNGTERRVSKSTQKSEHHNRRAEDRIALSGGKDEGFEEF